MTCGPLTLPGHVLEPIPTKGWPAPLPGSTFGFGKFSLRLISDFSAFASITCWPLIGQRWEEADHFGTPLWTAACDREPTLSLLFASFAISLLPWSLRPVDLRHAVATATTVWRSSFDCPHTASGVLPTGPLFGPSTWTALVFWQSCESSSAFGCCLGVKGACPGEPRESAHRGRSMRGAWSPSG